MRAMLDNLWWRGIAGVGVLVSVFAWRPLSDLLTGWLEPWAGWGLRTGMHGVNGFTADANPLGVLGGLAVLMFAVALATAPAAVFVIAWKKVLAVGLEESGPAMLRVAWIAGIVMIGSAVIGWIDAGQGSMTLDAAWPMSVICFLWGLTMLSSQRFQKRVARVNVIIVLLTLVGVSILLGLLVVPLFL